MPHRRPSVALFCGAPHPDPAKRFALCRSLLGYFPGFQYELATIHDHAPVLPDLVNLGVLWAHCANRHCGKWNAFRIVPPADDLEDDDDVTLTHIVEP